MVPKCVYLLVYTLIYYFQYVILKAEASPWATLFSLWRTSCSLLRQHLVLLPRLVQVSGSWIFCFLSAWRGHFHSLVILGVHILLRVKSYGPDCLPVSSPEHAGKTFSLSLQFLPGEDSFSPPKFTVVPPINPSKVDFTTGNISLFT